MSFFNSCCNVWFGPTTKKKPVNLTATCTSGLIIRKLKTLHTTGTKYSWAYPNRGNFFHASPCGRSIDYACTLIFVGSEINSWGQTFALFRRLPVWFGPTTKRKPVNLTATCTSGLITRNLQTLYTTGTKYSWAYRNRRNFYYAKTCCRSIE